MPGDGVVSSGSGEPDPDPDLRAAEYVLGTLDAHERAELENVLLPGHRLVLLAELLSESFAALDVVRADKVACDLDAIRKIAYLHDIVI